MIAYFILVHRYPEQFKRLFRSIYNSSNYYLIHIDKKSSSGLYEDISKYLDGFLNVQILESQNVVWGGYSMVDVEIKAIKQLLKMSPSWTSFINLSGQDFPLKSKKFTANTTKALVASGEIKLRPKTLRLTDFSFLSKSTALFARKLDETVDAALFTKIEISIIDKQPRPLKVKAFKPTNLINPIPIFQSAGLA